MKQLKNETIIEFTGVSKNYGALQALSDVSFSIKKGEIFGYIGPNGAGKTTTLKILVGLIRDYQGEVFLDGELLSQRSPPGNCIGYLPQDVGFQEWRTVDHALTTFGLLSGLSREEIQKRIPEVLEIVNLVDARKRKIKHLSGGMQQKLKLAQALLHEPKILVLDEPMSGLDPTSRYQMKNIIRKLAKQDITIIFSSHILKEVEDIVTTIGIINKGTVVKLGKPEEMQKEIIGGEAIEIIGNNIAEKADVFYQFKEIAKIVTREDYPDHLTIIFESEINLETIILSLLDFLASNKIVITNFNYVKPSLEQVYMKYVLEEVA